MSDEALTPAEQASKEAAHAAKNAAQKVELARQLQFQEMAEEIARTAAKTATSVALSEAATVAKKIVGDARESAAKLLSDTSEHVTNIGVIANDLAYVRRDVADIKPKLEEMAHKLDNSVKEERGISNKAYAPYLAWTVVLGLLGVFGIAIAQKLVTLVGI